jgi:cytochrome d ubiquinol oxidase subunit II
VLLKALPLIFILGGVILYVVLGGADFGAGACRLFAGRGQMGDRIRDHAHNSMGPVWEANHVWLIFVLTVTWTAYPRVFGSVASTLALPLFIAGLGIVVRGASYALRSAAQTESELRRVDYAFGVVSLLTPFMFGAAAGALAAERVPLGNAAGGLFSSWTGPVSILVGALSVTFSAYLAAVFLAADAVRHHEPDLEAAMKRRALLAGAVAGALAVVGLIVIHADAHGLYAGLVHGTGLAFLIVSVLFGLTTVGLVWFERFEWARYSSAAAVACVVAGWAAARWPELLPGVSISQAAASHDTLICVVCAVVGGGVLLFPSLGLLFTLTLRGQLNSHDLEGADETASGRRAALDLSRAPLVRGGPRLAGALLLIGVGMLNGADAPWCHIVGVVSLLGFLLTGFLTVMSGMVGPDTARSADP